MATSTFKLNCYAVNEYLHKVGSKLTYWGKCIQYNWRKTIFKMIQFLFNNKHCNMNSIYWIPNSLHSTTSRCLIPELENCCSKFQTRSGDHWSKVWVLKVFSVQMNCSMCCFNPEKTACREMFNKLMVSGIFMSVWKVMQQEAPACSHCPIVYNEPSSPVNLPNCNRFSSEYYSR